MTLDLTGIQNIGEFYSHHYLDALLENDLKGLFIKWHSDDETAGNSATPDRQLNRLAGEYFKAKADARPELSIQSRYEPSHRLHVALMEALGYSYKFDLRYIKGELAIPILGGLKRDGQEYLWLIETPFPGKEEWMDSDTSPLDQRPFRQQYPIIDQAFVIPDSRWEDLIGDIFHSDEPPRWLIFLTGRYVYLVDRTKWGRGQYLLFDLDEIMGRRQSQTLRATAALLSQDALCPEEGVPLHDTLDENSHKHAYSVSSDLKYGIRRAVELLANEYVWYQRNVSRGALFQDEDLARKLTDETLTYLYRLLFLLYAEARAGELDVVPMKSEAYQKGYSLETLRDLELVPLTTPQVQNGYFINDSLTRLFSLVDEGHQPQQLSLNIESDALIGKYDDYGFRVKGLHSPLFNRESTPLLSSVRFRNIILQEVIQLLSLSKETNNKKSQRGRISYAQLGINQLGAVYEALLSYSGFFATERLFEVKPAESKDADETSQTYFVPEDKLERYLPEEFVYEDKIDGSSQRKIFEKGSFIFRLAGRDREKSASYYTPEVLTQCVVNNSLKELLKEKTADEILQITICEPAMGSGAFINESLNQLADTYLERKQKELAKKISPDEYRIERQKVKFYLAVNNAYGVDLNPTAVRLAEVSFWLNILYPNAPVPWFNARLSTGNSLIGARRQVYSIEDVKSGVYASKPPTFSPLNSEVKNGDSNACRIFPRKKDSIYHWLLPDTGMAAFDSDKVIKELATIETDFIKKWRKEFTKPFTAMDIRNMVVLSDQADELWQKALDERLLFLSKTQQCIDIWGQLPHSKDRTNISIQQCERELNWLSRPNGPYSKLKLAMDYWCALWFWKIPNSNLLPTRSQFLEDIKTVFALEDDYGFEKSEEQLDLFASSEAKQNSLTEFKLLSNANFFQNNQRLDVVRSIATQQCFHHWDLVFSDVFSRNGGFDLILGNPPWVSVAFDAGGVVSDFDPLVVVRKYSATKVDEMLSDVLKVKEIASTYINEFVEQNGIKNYYGSVVNGDLLAGKINLYKCFVLRSWEIGSKNGIAGFLHPEGIYDDPKSGRFREEVYHRLKAHFQFQNELKLFPDIGNRNKFSINIYSITENPDIEFTHMSNLFHPITIEQSLIHDGFGETPGIKDKNGNWGLKGHRNRIIIVNERTLQLCASVFDENGINPVHARLPIIHSTGVIGVFEGLTNQTIKLGQLSGRFYVTPTTFWNETSAQQDGFIKRETQFPNSAEQLIFSGPHFYVNTPIYQTPNEGCSSHRDYSSINLKKIEANYLPRTNYLPACEQKTYLEHIPIWRNQPITNYYRQFFRAMLANASERTLIGCIAPPNVAHINGVQSYSFDNFDLLLLFSAMAGSLVYDFYIKCTGKQNLHELATLLPIPNVEDPIKRWLFCRVLLLNCLIKDYANLWQENFSPRFLEDNWSIVDKRCKPYSSLMPKWEYGTPLRSSLERRQAEIEIDVLACIALGLNLDELLVMYRVQFPVLQEHENILLFDQHGMEVPMKTVGGILDVDKNHPKFAQMVPPFTPVNREEDYRVAWKFFEQKLTNEKREGK